MFKPPDCSVFWNLPAGGLKFAGYSRHKDQWWREVPTGYLLVYVTSGRGWYGDARGKSCAVSAGDVIVGFPGDELWYGPQGTWDEVALGFAGPLFNGLEHCGQLQRAQPILRLSPVALWVHRLSVFLESVGRVGAMPEQDLCRFLLLLGELTRSASPMRGASSFVERARELLEADLSGDKDLSAIAAQLGVAPRTLRQRFHAETGISPGQYRAERRIEAAKRLLELELSQRDIAETLGFADEAHFRKRFKQLSKLTPAQFRRSRGT